MIAAIHVNSVEIRIVSHHPRILFHGWWLEDLENHKAVKIWGWTLSVTASTCLGQYGMSSQQSTSSTNTSPHLLR